MNKFDALKNFLRDDIKIKELILKLAPTYLDDYNEESRIEYTDRLNKGLKELELMLSDTVDEFDFGKEIKDAIKRHFIEQREALLNSNYEYGRIKDIYNNKFSSMNEKFVETVKEECVAYARNDTKTLQKMINKSNTINELLHVMHSHILNNEEIMQSMPILAKKENSINEPITLYGEETKTAKKIFDEFPLELDCGITDIISMDGKILMMIRDRGHALTIEIDKLKDGNSQIKYFIPKLCNRSMIEKLPGIGKISKNCAIGIFDIIEEDLPEKLYDFIEKVPTDADMLQMNVSDKQLNELENQDYIFEDEDARDIAMEKGTNGRKITNIQKLQQKIKETIKNLKQKNTSKKMGENENDRIRD